LLSVLPSLTSESGKPSFSLRFFVFSSANLARSPF
jgi:hypothetical protein